MSSAAASLGGASDAGAASARPKARIAVLSLGGTIAMSRRPDDGGATPTLSADDLVRALPGLADLAQVESQSFLQLPSVHLEFGQLEALALHIVSLQDSCDGIVVTQGTDTIEETAFVLDRLVPAGKPLVVTGAMRTPQTPGADGPANLLAAACVASSPDARHLGCVVVFNDEVHSARFVRKAHTSSPAAFVSPAMGPIGYVVENRFRLLASPPVVAPIARAAAPAPARVAFVTAVLDDPGDMLQALAVDWFDGIVVAATGGGHVSPGLARAIGLVAQRMPVVIASRTGAGELLAGSYGFVGSEIDLARRGAIRAGWLEPLKARVLLALLLRHGTAPGAIAEAFRPWGGAVT